MNLSNTNFVPKSLRAVFVMLSFCCLTVQAQNRYFTVKGKGVNVRKAPVSGSVIGKVSPPCSFYSEEKDGWVELWHDGQWGYISSQFVEEVELADFSRKHLGQYMGIPSPLYSDGYCLVTLKEKDGYVLMRIGDYSAPQEGGFRNQMFWTYVGIPEKNGVRFTHELYPYYKDVPVVEQMTAERKMDDYVLVAGKDGTLYTPDRTLEPQETARDAEDLPLTERSLFMLRGDVKSVYYLRSYSEAYLRDDKDAPFSNFAHIYNFSEEGDLTGVSLYDGNINKMAEYTFARQGDNVIVSDTIHSFHAEYVRDISNFEISYNGDWSRDDGSAGSIGNTYAFDMKGRMAEQSFDRCAPPFLSYGDGDGDYQRYRYGTDSTLPDNIYFDVSYGGDGWFLQADIKDMKIDTQGNWTERKAFDEGGNLLFMEKRKISYYGTPQTDGADNAGAAYNNIHATAEQNPEYPGGAAAMMAFIASNLKYPALCQENGIKGRVVLKFVVETDGSIGEIKTVSSPHYLLEKEAVRIVRKMPKWKPGRQSGRPVRVWYTVPVNFALD